ncbi:MAG: hypothetical protein HY917_03140 [Candidatus Diapherotrites archaeon]|nr:hypothetical protein [Candidatus Diapherotrites archaeon]
MGSPKDLRSIQQKYGARMGSFFSAHPLVLPLTGVSVAVILFAGIVLTLQGSINPLAILPGFSTTPTTPAAEETPLAPVQINPVSPRPTLPPASPPATPPAPEPPAPIAPPARIPRAASASASSGSSPNNNDSSSNNNNGGPPPAPEPVPLPSVTYTFSAGFNGFALSLAPSTPLSAQTILSKLADCEKISRINPSLKGKSMDAVSFSNIWQDYNKLDSGNQDFPILNGEGYLVFCRQSDSTLTYSGTAPASFTGPSLQIGYNAIGLPGISLRPDLNSAQALLESVQTPDLNCSSIALFENGNWKMHSFGIPVNNFALDPKKSYVISCQPADTTTAYSFTEGITSFGFNLKPLSAMNAQQFLEQLDANCDTLLRQLPASAREEKVRWQAYIMEPTPYPVQLITGAEYTNQPFELTAGEGYATQCRNPTRFTLKGKPFTEPHYPDVTSGNHLTVSFPGIEKETRANVQTSSGLLDFLNRQNAVQCTQISGNGQTYPGQDFPVSGTGAYYLYCPPQFFERTLLMGWNSMTIDVNLFEPLSAKKLLTDLNGNCTYVTRATPAKKGQNVRMEEFLQIQDANALAAEDFNLMPFEGYLLHCEAPVTLSLHGTKIQEPALPALSDYYNLISIPAPPASLSAETFLQEARTTQQKNCTQISRWYRGSIQAHEWESDENDFTLSSEEAYLVHCPVQPQEETDPTTSTLSSQASTALR